MNSSDKKAEHRGIAWGAYFGILIGIFLGAEVFNNVKEINDIRFWVLQVSIVVPFFIILWKFYD